MRARTHARFHIPAYSKPASVEGDRHQNLQSPQTLPFPASDIYRPANSLRFSHVVYDHRKSRGELDRSAGRVDLTLASTYPTAIKLGPSTFLSRSKFTYFETA